MSSIGYATMSVIPSAKGFGAALTKGIAPEMEAAGKASGLSFGKGMVAGTVAIATAVIGIGVAATLMAAKMQESDARIQANAQITAKAATGIGDAFLATAGKSTFTGKAMADAFGPVAGVVQTLTGHTLTAADALKVMAASTDLAEASGVPLTATTADLTAVLRSFGIGLSGASDASNILFNTSRLTGVGLDTLTSTVDKLHGKLGIASPSLAGTSALMVDLAMHGIAGSRGILVVNGALSTLLGSSKGTVDELKHLGVNVYDSTGKFVGMGAVLSQLTPKLKGMSDQQRNVALSALFGKAGAAALTQTVLAGAAGYDKATKAVTAHDAVQKAAVAMSSTLAGQWTTLTATVADLWTMLGEKLMPTVIKGMSFVNTTAIPAIKNFVKGFQDGTGPGGKFKDILTTIYKDGIQPIASFITGTALPAVKDFIKGFQDGTGPGGKLRDILTDIYNAAAKVAGYISGTVVPDIKDFSKWMVDNRSKIEGVVAGITVLLLPALIRMAVIATISGAETAAIWLMIAADSVVGSVTSVASSVAVGAAWVWSGIVAMAAGIEMAAAWLIGLGPIGWVIIAIAAVVAVIVVIATKTTWFQTIWQYATSSIAAAWNWLWHSVLAPAISWMLNAFANVASSIGGVLVALGHIPNFGWAKTAGEYMLTAANHARDLANGITAIPKNVAVDVTFSSNFSWVNQQMLSLQNSKNKLAANPTGHALGGLIGGTGRRDTEPAMLTPGEFVVRRDGSNISDALKHFGVSGAQAAGTAFDYDRMAAAMARAQIVLDGKNVTASVDTRIGALIR